MQKALAIAAVLLSAMIMPQALAQESVSVSGLGAVDDKGAPVQNIMAGDLVSIQSVLKNNEQEKQAFVQIVQIQDSGGYVVFLALANGTLEKSQTLHTGWQPEEEGRYTVQVFVWTSIDSPLPLSLDVQKFTIDVKAQPTVKCSGSATCFAGTVTKITDGDTIRIDGIAIRLALVNTPERGEQGYSEATGFTSALCPVGSTALVDEDDGQTEGSYGRMVAKVYCDGKMLNEELLRAGHAVMYTRYCKVSEFATEQWAVEYGC
jgi:nuclease-like protein